MRVSSYLLSKAVFVGRVVSNRMPKTVLVAVDKVKYVPKYKTYIKRQKKYMAHDEQQACDIGDIVRIETSRHRTERKYCDVVRIVRKIPVYQPEEPPTEGDREGEQELLDNVTKWRLELARRKARLRELRGAYDQRPKLLQKNEAPSPVGPDRRRSSPVTRIVIKRESR